MRCPNPTKRHAGTAIVLLLLSSAIVVPACANLDAQTAGNSPATPSWQTEAGDKMSFEVASIRPSKPGEFTAPGFPLSPDDSYVPNTNNFLADFPLETYILFAYKLWLTHDQRQAMLAGLPKWVATEYFVIHARAQGTPTKDQMRLMVQSLLADRFHLILHFEKREVPVYALVLAKDGKTGVKLRPHADGPACDSPSKGLPAKSTQNYPRECSVFGLMMQPDHTLLAGSRDTTMELIASSLASLPGGVSRPVVDRTGLKGRFDFSIQWTPETNASSAANDQAPLDPEGTSFLEAVNDQLGLKLKPERAPLDVPVIDHVELPSEN